MKLAMKVTAFAAVATLMACQPQTPADDAAEKAANAPMVLDSKDERLSYGIAHNLGGRLAADGIPVDVDAFAAGLRDAVEGNDPLLTQEEIMAEMQTFQQEQTERMQAEQATAAARNGEEGVAFLAENASKEGVVVLESGLQYKVIEAGDGAMPTAEDTVEVHYRGTLIDGTEFDSSYSRGQTVSFGVTQVISGWTEALQLMAVGSKWQLFLPAELAYGPGGMGNIIGPNATLLFDVELVSIAEK